MSEIHSLPATRRIVSEFRKRFVCRRCGGCCSAFDGVKISRGEMKRLEVPQSEWHDTFMLFARSNYMKQPCRFYNGAKGGCTVYKIRPRTCREFPMYIMERPRHPNLMVVSERCPAALQTLAEIEAECRGR